MSDELAAPPTLRLIPRRLLFVLEPLLLPIVMLLESAALVVMFWPCELLSVFGFDDNDDDDLDDDDDDAATAAAAAAAVEDDGINVEFELS